MGVTENHTFNITDDDRTYTQLSLKELNDKEARIYFGNVTLLSVLMLVGVIGNLHILHIYKHKKPKTVTRIYVIFLAIVDLIACGVVIPFNIATCLRPYMYYDTVSCKIFTFLKGLNSFGSACALLVIAIQRYRKICTPLRRQMTIRHAKLSCCFVILFAIISSMPILFLVGSTRMSTAQTGTYGLHCGTLAEMMDTYFYIIFMGYTVLFSSTACIVMMILYSLIGFKLLKQPKKVQRNQTIYLGNKENGGSSINGGSSRVEGTLYMARLDEERTQSVTNVSTCTVADSYIGGNVQASEDSFPVEHSANHEHDTSNDKSKKRPETGNSTNKSLLDKTNSKRKTKNGTTTKTQRWNCIFFLITLCYVVSYIPYPVLRICQTLNTEWYEGLDLNHLIVFYTFIGTLYINNVVNSFIYALCDSHYRQEIKAFYTKLFRK